MPTALVTGSAGFIGFHIANQLLQEGWRVIGIDSLSDYYDLSLKNAREALLLEHEGYRSVHEKIEAPNILNTLFDEEKPDYVVHLAAQPGVRGSIDNPRPYLQSNINGTFELLEAARHCPPKHMLLASTSSIFGANEKMPYAETDKADQQMSFYAATKKATESIAHSYSHLYGLPITMFRFFTVYGPWGRPDMAMFKFTKATLSGDPIDVYNNGNMKRDFTFIDDLNKAIRLLMDVIPLQTGSAKESKYDSLSSVAPFRIVNIGNSQPVDLIDFIKAVELATGKTAKLNLLPMQPGDVVATWADTTLLKQLTGFSASTSVVDGVKKFVDWYRSYYGL
ncbi:NAD-dependent epimerase/dehydratase family protein [uncultured Cohaesibacter sp.]|uniref:NAD-dependent epimerase/dehydratase family protein n=1 Tax=uncultured Cohaesibacter sp. TaxID=1002546 RepID=UPI002930C6A2|nr:NAD-dependent epimerase/dehydratase family protein [uncultured Cohaesibacter sp.]